MSTEPIAHRADEAAPGDPSRRRAIGGGGALVLAFAIRPHRAFAQTETASAAGGRLPGSLVKAPWLDAWIRIDAQGGVTVFTGKAELGQGIKTALIQVAAEELVVAPARVSIVTADTARTADEGYTAGSHSMQDSGTAIRHAAAQVRVLLASRAASRLGAAANALRLVDGTFTAPNGGLISYGALVAGEVLHVAAAPQSDLRPPAVHTVMGKAFARIDIPGKVSGGLAYVQDLRLADMVHGRVVRPPSVSATLRSVDTARALAMPGVLKVVQDGRFLGVIARGEWQAVQAARVLAGSVRWQERATLPKPGDLYAAVAALPSEDDTIADRTAPVASAGAGPRLLVTYRRPFQMHGSIGPSCAIARLAADGHWTVWTHTQGVFPLRHALAELLGAPLDMVRCIHVEGSGCYGHNGADDVAGDAVLLARAWPGAPVRVQWMREDEHGFEPLGPAMITRLQAALDASGAIADWRYEVWSAPHSARPGTAGDLLAGTLVASPFAPSAPQKLAQPEGGGDRNAIPLYRLPSLNVVHHFQPHPFVRTSALRSLGAYFNVFTIESAMDELALAARADPVMFRLRHLDDPRARDVVRVAAEQFGWGRRVVKPGRGLGFAFARYKNLAAYAAVAVEVEVRRDTGEIRVVEVVASVDCGEVVNADGVRNQMEGGVVQSTSWTTVEEVAFNTMSVTSRDWGGYPILRFPQVPGSIDIRIVDRPGLPFLGVGEAAQGPTAAAIGNAVAAATGVRFRELPLSRPKIRAALLG